jgi:pSer/pThr/pTyr-binding forkhead associated (FHA) protein
VVFRGEARDTKSLDQLPVRLGRGPQNDIVLEDPAKSVSRVHAEIRLEGGRYVLVDLKSDNGIWVAGSRVARVELKPNVVASIGPFRLQLETDDAGTINSDSGKTAGTHPVVPSQRPNRSSTAPSPAIRRPGGWTPRAIWAAAIATGLATAAIIAAVIFLQPAPPAEIPPELIREIAAAKLQISQGSCAEALAQHIDPALARYSGNTDLLALKRQAEACVPAAPPPEQGPDPIAASLQSARDLIAAGDCSGALDLHISNVLSVEPENPMALELKTQAEACVKSSQPGSRIVLAKKIPPADGGLDPLAGEQDEAYRLRIKAMRERYDEAVATASKGPSRAAISLFEAIAKETPPGYLDVNTKVAEARGAWRATARPLVTEARDLAGKEMWNEALQKLREARAIDPSLSIDDDMRNIDAAKLVAGQQACRLGKQTVNYNHAQAVQHFRRAIALLPPDDPCYAAAKKYVDSAGGG